MKAFAVWLAAVATVIAAGSVRAHHSISMFDIGKPIWIKGTVVRFDLINPHVMFTLQQTTDDGRIQQWTVEGSGLNTFTRRGLGADYLQAGDVVEVCGFDFKEDVLARARPAEAGRPRSFLHGHVLVMSDEQLRLFGGYGKLQNCIRRADRVESWLNFLNTDERARAGWCNSRVAANFPLIASQAFVDEIDRRMTTACPP
jgi:hypothetical protein